METQSYHFTVKPVYKGHSQRDQELVFKTNYPLLHVKSIAECSPWSILQYFRPSLDCHLSLRSLFCLFLSGRLRQVLLYIIKFKKITLLYVLFRFRFFLFCYLQHVQNVHISRM